MDDIVSHTQIGKDFSDINARYGDSEQRGLPVNALSGMSLENVGRLTLATDHIRTLARMIAKIPPKYAKESRRSTTRTFRVRHSLRASSKTLTRANANITLSKTRKGTQYAQR